MVFSALPQATIADSVFTSLTTAGHSLYSLNAFIPVNTFGYVVGIYIGVEIAIMMFKFLRFMVGFIPFIGH